MTKEEKIEILNLIENILTGCSETLYIPSSDGEGSYRSYVDPEKAWKAIRDLKESLERMGDL